MHPTVATVAGVPIGTHGFFVALGVLAAAWVFVVKAKRRGQTDDRIVYVVLGALAGGAVFMRLGTWMQHLDIRENASLAEQWLYGNRSILGGCSARGSACTSPSVWWATGSAPATSSLPQLRWGWRSDGSAAC